VAQRQLTRLAAIFFLLTVTSVVEAAPGRTAVLTDLEIKRPDGLRS